MMAKTYLEKLRDPRWQKKRLQILERDNWTCQECKDTETCLHVHHKVYQWGLDPWDYPDETLITLCEKCHEKERNKGRVNLQIELEINYDCGCINWTNVIEEALKDMVKDKHGTGALIAMHFMKKYWGVTIWNEVHSLIGTENLRLTNEK